MPHGVWVRVPPSARMSSIKETTAYIIGVSLGDGNLSNPNGRAVRLRITCHTKYPGIIARIVAALQNVFPHNKVSLVKGGKPSYVNISCYSNGLEKILGWKANGGSKFNQNATIPEWIKRSPTYAAACVRGLLETDGSVYTDRGYKMVNFTTTIALLAKDVVAMIRLLGFVSHCYTISTMHKTKYILRISKNVPQFIKKVHFTKD